MSLYLFPYRWKDGKLANPDIWTGGVRDHGALINRDLRVYPPSEEVRRHLAVRALEALLAYVGELPSGEVDGVFRWKTKRAVKRFQREEGLPTPGYVGPKTAAHLCFSLVDEVERELRIPGHLLFGSLSHESSFDFGIIGSTDPFDRFLAQINRKHHGTGTPDNISDEQAADPIFSIPYDGQRMRSFFDANPHKDVELRWNAAILQHNNPRGAKELLKTGKYAEPKFETYVSQVRAAARRAPD